MVLTILSSLLWLCVLDLGQSASVNTFHCSLGEYVHTDQKGKKSCEPCPDGTFMDQPKHTNVECASCKEAFYFNNEVVAKTCTKTEDSVILCAEKSFMNRNTGDIVGSYCQKCQVCGRGRVKDFPYLIKPCGAYDNTVCGKSRYCGLGQFLHRDSWKGQESCEDCPAGTFMDKSWHRDDECKKCQRAQEFIYEVEAQKCTATSDTVIMCDKNHFRVEPGPLLPNYCQRCLECGMGKESGRPFETVPCGAFSDTVCGVN